jgi:5-methylcytosine-specific restriction endonuclease McrA
MLLNLSFLRKKTSTWYDLDFKAELTTPFTYYNRYFRLTSHSKTKLNNFVEASKLYQKIAAPSNLESSLNYYLRTKKDNKNVFNLDTGKWINVTSGENIFQSINIELILFVNKLLFCYKEEIEDFDIDIDDRFVETISKLGEHNCSCCLKLIDNEHIVFISIIPLTKGGSASFEQSILVCKQCRNISRCQNIFEYMIEKKKPGCDFLDEDDIRVKMTRIYKNFFDQLQKLDLNKELKKDFLPQRTYDERLGAALLAIKLSFGMDT